MRRKREILGVGEVADRIGLKRDTVYVMNARGQLPPEDLVVGGRKLWYSTTIDRWDKKRPKR